MKTYRKSEASWSHNRNQKMTTILYSNQVILPPFPPLGEGGEGGRGGPNFVVTLASKHFTKCTRLYLSDFLPTCGYEQAVHPPYQSRREIYHLNSAKKITRVRHHASLFRCGTSRAPALGWRSCPSPLGHAFNLLLPPFFLRHHSSASFETSKTSTPSQCPTKDSAAWGSLPSTAAPPLPPPKKL